MVTLNFLEYVDSLSSCSHNTLIYLSNTLKENLKQAFRSHRIEWANLQPMINLYFHCGKLLLEHKDSTLKCKFLCPILK
jgi:hypothetical protein